MCSPPPPTRACVCLCEGGGGCIWWAYPSVFNTGSWLIELYFGSVVLSLDELCWYLHGTPSRWCHVESVSPGHPWYLGGVMLSLSLQVTNATSSRWWLVESVSPWSADARRWSNVGLTLVQRRRRWTNVKPTLIQRLVSAVMLSPSLQVTLVSYDLKQFLQLHHHLPVRLPHVVTEVILYGVYGFPANLKTQNKRKTVKFEV